MSKELEVQRDIDLLSPVLKAKVIFMLQELAMWDLPFEVFETGRLIERQQHLIDIGSSWTLKGKHVIGNGVRELSDAVDFVYCPQKFRWSWNYKLYRRQYNELGEIGKRLDLVWGGNWKSCKDPPHFQLNARDALLSREIERKAKDV